MVKYTQRLGEVRSNIYGTPMKIIEYIDANHIQVEFQDEHKHITFTKYEHFVKGTVGNPHDKTVAGVGIVGVGKHIVSKNSKSITKYNHWFHMIKRCNSDKYKYRYYKECSVCDEWTYYQNYGDWFEDNYYEIDGHKMHMDKDILVKGNKIYSPDTCVFVPAFLNSMFTKNNIGRGDLPIGVERAGNRYIASCSKSDNKSHYLGAFDNPEEAFYAYKDAKETHIKNTAEQYKDKIPNKLYEALMRYEVDIDD